MISLSWKIHANYKNGDDFRYNMITYFEDMPNVIGYDANGKSSNNYPNVVFDFDESISTAFMHVFGNNSDLVNEIKSRIKLEYPNADIIEVVIDESSVYTSEDCSSFVINEMSLNGREIKEAFKSRNFGMFKDKQIMTPLIVNRIFAGILRWQKAAGLILVDYEKTDRQDFFCNTGIEYDEVKVIRTSRGARAVVINLKFKAKLKIDGAYPLFVGAEVNKGYGKIHLA